MLLGIGTCFKFKGLFRSRFNILYALYQQVAAVVEEVTLTKHQGTKKDCFLYFRRFSCFVSLLLKSNHISNELLCIIKVTQEKNLIIYQSHGFRHKAVIL